MHTDTTKFENGYSEVNGLRMYYEIHGSGKPLVLIHGGGSTINTTFGRVLPLLAEKHQVIAIELQAHGRTRDRDQPLSFEQDADDVAALLKNLNIAKADVFGFSNGGTTAFQMAIRHPEVVDKMIVASPIFKTDGIPDMIWDFIRNGTFEQMPQPLKDDFRSINPDENDLHQMFTRDQERMRNFRDIPEELIASIKAKTLILIGDKDVTKATHALEMNRLIAGSALMIIPGAHGEYIGEITTLSNRNDSYKHVIALIENFLN